MARFEMELPNDLIKQFEDLNKNTTKMLEEMVRAGGASVIERVKGNVPTNWLTSDIMRCLKITQTYKTPSDDGVNCKVAFYGYFTNEQGVKTPAPLVANVTEYGRSNSPYPRKPFMRKSFNKAELEKVMLKVQEKYIKE